MCVYIYIYIMCIYIYIYIHSAEGVHCLSESQLFMAAVCSPHTPIQLALMLSSLLHSSRVLLRCLSAWHWSSTWSKLTCAGLLNVFTQQLSTMHTRHVTNLNNT